MFRKYEYKPKLLCYDVYGYKELYFIILVINEMISVKDFRKKKIKMLYTEDMNNLSNSLKDISYHKRKINTSMGISMGIMNGITIITIFVYAIYTNMKYSDIILFSTLFENIFGIFAFFTDIYPGMEFLDKVVVLLLVF